MKSAWLCATALLLSACTFPGELIRVSPANGPIVGIKQFLGGQEPVHVILVHGMCTHQPDWVDSANQQLANALGLQPDPLPTPPKQIGSHGGRLFQRSLVANGREQVRTFALLWSPIVAEAKTRLCYDQTEATTACASSTKQLDDHRVLLNALIKNTVMDECLSDAVFYAGSIGRPLISEAMHEGLAIALAGGAPSTASERASLELLERETAPLFLITESLGSKMVNDALIEMASPTCETHKRVAASVSRTRQVFMEANQLPIISLAYDPPLLNRCLVEADKDFSARELAIAPRGFAALATLHQEGRALRKAGEIGSQEVGNDRIKVAAFSDPNDVLSYTLVPWVTDGSFVAVDVVMGDAFPWFGLFEDPWTAHTSYGSRPLVQRIIACGVPGTSASC